MNFLENLNMGEQTYKPHVHQWEFSIKSFVLFNKLLIDLNLIPPLKWEFSIKFGMILIFSQSQSCRNDTKLQVSHYQDV